MLDVRDQAATSQLPSLLPPEFQEVPPGLRIAQKPDCSLKRWRLSGGLCR